MSDEPEPQDVNDPEDTYADDAEEMRSGKPVGPEHDKSFPTYDFAPEIDPKEE